MIRVDAGPHPVLAAAPPFPGAEGADGASAPLSYTHAMQLETLDRSSRLSHWMNAFAADEEAFASKAVFVEMRLRQALSSSVTLGVPNTFRCAVVCDAFERVAPMTGRYEGVLGLIWKELVRAISSRSMSSAECVNLGLLVVVQTKGASDDSVVTERCCTHHHLDVIAP